VVSHLPRAVRRAIGLPAWPPGGVVLLYHRVAELTSDPQCLAVSPSRFADHLDVIRRHGAPVSLDDLVDRAQRETVPAGAVAITFDDGYADNLMAAVPLLAAAEMPATVMVSTAPLTHGREFWWDELERLLLCAGSLPQRVRLTIGDQAEEWDLSGVEEWSDADAARCSSWTVMDAALPTARHRLYLQLSARLKPLTERERERVLGDLADQAGQARAARPSHRALTRTELVALAATEGISVGSHTHSHSSLAGLAPDEQQREIAEARQTLESLTGQPVKSFAYPFGGAAHLSARTRSLVHQEGITVACRSDAGSVRFGCDPLAVPRIVMRNWSKDEFGEQWQSWVGHHP
jgi:peptidoglycan/xylan/chitin deacetylase (PgdA/CDA1 family)